jgi:putative oxidoreductase
VASFETVGGLLLILGLASRLIAIPLTVVLCTAYATAHRAALLNIFDDPETFISQPPFNFLVMCLIVFAFGPGKYSLDYLIERKVKL